MASTVAASAEIRERKLCNKQAEFCLSVDFYMLVVAGLWIWFATYAAHTHDLNVSGHATTSASDFNWSDFFKHCTVVPVVAALHWLVWGSDEFKNDTDKHRLLYIIAIGYGATAATVLVSIAQAGINVDPTTILAAAASAAFAYLHFQAASRFQPSPTTKFSASLGPVAKSQAVLVRLVIVLDAALLFGLIAMRTLVAVTAGDVLSMPLAATLVTALVAFNMLSAAGSSCVHVLRHNLIVGMIFAAFLRLATIGFKADTNTQMMELLSYGLLPLHLALFFLEPLLTVYLLKWSRFKRWITNFSPGEAYAAE